MRSLEGDHHEEWRVFIVGSNFLDCLLTVHLSGEHSLIIVTDIFIPVQVITYLGFQDSLPCKRR